MGAADVFVSASLWEGLPNALMEAMVCGIPVIASDCNAGPRELLAPKTEHTKRLSSGIEQTEYGILTAVSDTAALVEALTLLLQDSALRQGYAAASTTRAQAFAEAPLLDAYCSALLEVR
jgi:N-acetylgalactosamine-N,N'-diacetylbacillosaminyl-diphospho-undecaprenol 4-alpha-N-acetylgalactosaminyltransferase